MVTPVFLIADESAALAFYIGWLGFRIDWEEQPKRNRVYLQISRNDVVLHLSDSPADSAMGAAVRMEVRGLPAYHRRLMSKDQPPMQPTLAPAYWNERVLEMEVLDPFGNRLIFCEPGALEGG
ncbi:glyoxalase superfamily protein [Hymenobacter negativus]|uniref:Bleomycin resistance protein n=1 Tax=Hymenobacter negativus TaxID=2795026 RepID=A0ABS3QM36_9BACT|nr:glyoxalase superfamily protein [Hymenobacter negativus]MBO2012331.1 VOC family protein [Hymenobacter negativus]